MKNKIRVSVIIPVFNSEKYLSQCLASIANQTLKDIEIICINNGSDDNSSSILQNFTKKDPRFVLINTPKSNAGAARNLGMSIAKGKYLSFVDSDDYCELNMLETTYSAAEKNKSDIVVFQFNVFDDKNNCITQQSVGINSDKPSRTINPVNINKTLFGSFKNCPWNKLFLKDFIIKNKISFQEIPRSNDIAFTFISLALAKRITIKRQSLINYRTNIAGSLQSTNELSPLASWDACRRVKALLQENNKYEIYEQSFLNETLDILLYNLNRMPQNTPAYNYLFSTIRYGSEIEFGFLAHKATYYRENNYNKYQEIINTPSVEEEVRRAVLEITSSKSHKIGLAITKIPRQLKKKLKHNN